VLRGFLGTYVSRYSDWDGFWLFGFLVSELRVMEIDLLGAGGDVAPADTPEAAARALATSKFRDQLAKVGLPAGRVEAASLTLERLAPATGLADGVARAGFQLRFRAATTTDTGRVFEAEQIVFVAPHDPRVERRSARALPP